MINPSRMRHLQKSTGIGGSLTTLPVGACHSPFLTTPKEPEPSFSPSSSSLSWIRHGRARPAPSCPWAGLPPFGCSAASPLRPLIAYKGRFLVTFLPRDTHLDVNPGFRPLGSMSVISLCGVSEPPIIAFELGET